MKPMTHALFASLVATTMIAAPLSSQRGGQRPREANKSTEHTVSFESRNGTSLSELLELIRQKTGANIVASEEADDILLPRMSLQKASLGAALEAITQIVPSYYTVKVRANHDVGGKPVYAVQVQSRKRPKVSNKSVLPRLEVRVFSLRELILPPPGIETRDDLVLRDESVLNAIDVGLNIQPTGTKAVMKFHVDSGLLFVRGTPQQIHVCEEVLSNLRNDLMRRRQEYMRHEMTRRMQTGRGVRTVGPGRTGGQKKGSR